MSDHIGFAHTKNKNDYFLNKINFNYDELVKEDLDLSMLYNKQNDKYRSYAMLLFVLKMKIT